MSVIKHSLKRSVTRMQDWRNRRREEPSDRDDELRFELMIGLVWAHRSANRTEVLRRKTHR